MKVTMLCSGSTGNCTVVQDGDTQIIIDCGSTKKYLVGAMESQGIDYKQADAIVITHGHSDHIAQANTFRDIPMYATFPVKNIQNHLIKTHETFKIKDLEVTSLPLSHDFEKTVGYKFVGSKTLVYIADTGYLRENLFEEIKNADYLVLEANHDPKMLMKTNRPEQTKRRILSDEGHLSNASCAEILTQIVGDKTKEVVLAHISQEANTPELAYDFVSSYLEGKVDTSKFRLRAAGAFEVIVMGE